MKNIIIVVVLFSLPSIVFSQTDWGLDTWITGGPNQIISFDVDYVMDGTMYAVVQINNGTTNPFSFYISTDHGYSWDLDSSFSYGYPGIIFDEMRLLAGEPTQNNLYLFAVTDDMSYRCMVFDRNSLSFIGEYVIDTNLFSKSCFDVTRTFGNSYELWTIYWTDDSTINISKSTDCGVNWSLEKYYYSKGFDENVSICYGPTIGNFGNIYAVSADCATTADPESLVIWLYYESNGTWYCNQVTDNNAKDYDPHIAMSNDASNPAIWIVYTNDYYNSGDLDLRCSSIRTPDSIAYWHDNPVSNSSLYDEYWGDIKFYKSTGNRYINMCYIVDDVGGWKDVLWTYSSGSNYLNWSASVIINNHNAHSWPYGAAPRIAYSPGAAASGGGVLYASSGCYDLHCDFPWFTGVEEQPIEIEQPFLGSNMISDNYSVNYSITSSGKVEINIFDLSGRLIYQYGPIFINAGNYNLDTRDLNSGVYFFELKVEGSIQSREKFTVVE